MRLKAVEAAAVARVFDKHQFQGGQRRLLRMRSFITIGVFAAAAVVALRWPPVGMVLICLCLIGYLRPDVPVGKNVEH